MTIVQRLFYFLYITFRWCLESSNTQSKRSNYSSAIQKEECRAGLVVFPTHFFSDFCLIMYCMCLYWRFTCSLAIMPLVPFTLFEFTVYSFGYGSFLVMDNQWLDHLSTLLCKPVTKMFVKSTFLGSRGLLVLLKKKIIVLPVWSVQIVVSLQLFYYHYFFITVTFLTIKIYWKVLILSF